MYDVIIRGGDVVDGTGTQRRRADVGIIGERITAIGDLYKTQVWALVRYLGVPAAIVDKPATADLIKGQTDEIDLGVEDEDRDAGQGAQRADD